MSWVNLATTIYPIGAYYLSHTSTSPATLFGGTWSALTDRFLYCNANNNTGGSNTHTLTVNEMPAHNHKTSNGYHGTQWGDGNTCCSWTQYPEDGWSDNITSTTGEGAAHNNMPAYQACYAWRRTA